MAEKRDQEGNLIFGESHILCNLFSIKAIEKISGLSLPYHVALKKAQFLDESGKLIEKPDKPNAYKFESFLFDAFESLDKIENYILIIIKERTLKNKFININI